MKVQKEKPKVDNHFLIVTEEVNFLDRMYPTEEACFSEIWRRLRKGKRCQFCGSLRLKLRFGKRIGNCGKCGKKFRLTAGTIFERMRTARPYLVAIHLAEQGIPCSARLLSRVCGIVYATALGVSKKVMGAVSIAMQKSACLVSSFAFDSVICKRSRETSARKHPVSEQEELVEDHFEHPSSIKQIIDERIFAFQQSGSACTDVATSPEILTNGSVSTPSSEEQIYQLLSKEPLSMDHLIELSGKEPKVVFASITFLELADLVTRLPGDRVILSSERLSARSTIVDPRTEECVRQAILFIKKFFHGVSRKYIQIYLAAYWCFIDRARWANGAVFRQCCQTANIEMKSFVSPLELHFCAV